MLVKCANRKRGAVDMLAEARSWEIRRTPNGIALYHNGKRVMHFGANHDLQLAVEGGRRVVYHYDLKPDADFGTARYYTRTQTLGSVS